MKLLLEFTRLCLRGRALLGGGRRVCERSYVVTVPAPLGRLTIAPSHVTAGLPLPVVADNDTPLPSMRRAGQR